MDWTPILITGILLTLAIAVTCESVTAIFAALACACSLAGLPSYTLKSEIEQVWGLQEVSSECDLPDRELPTKNLQCYVTDENGHKELVEIRVSKDGAKLGLYDTNGKALKPVEKD